MAKIGQEMGIFDESTPTEPMAHFEEDRRATDRLMRHPRVK